VFILFEKFTQLFTSMGMVTSQQGWNYIISTIYIDEIIYPIFRSCKYRGASQLSVKPTARRDNQLGDTN